LPNNQSLALVRLAGGEFSLEVEQQDENSTGKK
jgi:hypothetical protein